jgi:FMN phosphatase YigB (HAD superfamily)
MSDDRVVFLVDVDNTLLDNDRLKTDLTGRIASTIGAERAARFWEIYEDVRHDEGFVDYPETVRRWASGYEDPSGGDELMALLDGVPFHDYVYPGAVKALGYLETIGTVAIVSDGDQVYQLLKIEKSGLKDAVHGNVMITVHKEHELKSVFDRFPARHYVVIDDKPAILSALERDCPSTFTTILVMQGKYAAQSSAGPGPDYTVQHIGSLRDFSPSMFLDPEDPEEADGEETSA